MDFYWAVFDDLGVVETLATSAPQRRQIQLSMDTIESFCGNFVLNGVRYDATSPKMHDFSREKQLKMNKIQNMVTKSVFIAWILTIFVSFES